MKEARICCFIHPVSKVNWKYGKHFIAAPTEEDDMETILDTDRCEHGFNSMRQGLLLNMTEISQLQWHSWKSVPVHNQNNQLCYSVSLQILCTLNWEQFECVTYFRHLWFQGRGAKKFSTELPAKKTSGMPSRSSFVSPWELPALLHSGRQLKSYPGKTSLSHGRKIQWFRIWICKLEWTVLMLI